MPALGDLESDCRSFEFDYVVGSWYMNPLAKVSSDSGEIGEPPQSGVVIGEAIVEVLALGGELGSDQQGVGAKCFALFCVPWVKWQWRR